MPWHAVSSLAMRTTADLIEAAGPDRLAGVRVIEVDEHRWAPQRVGPEGFVTLDCRIRFHCTRKQRAATQTSC
jgi:hypothetical protein